MFLIFLTVPQLEQASKINGLIFVVAASLVIWNKYLIGNLFGFCSSGFLQQVVERACFVLAHMKQAVKKCFVSALGNENNLLRVVGFPCSALATSNKLFLFWNGRCKFLGKGDCAQPPCLASRLEKAAIERKNLLFLASGEGQGTRAHESESDSGRAERGGGGQRILQSSCRLLRENVPPRWTAFKQEAPGTHEQNKAPFPPVRRRIS